ncbi:MAG: hypothetical protein ACLGSH_05870 [Acidobacteriota bacterium]
MIRQAISCDICGAEKKQTNHWFVACEVAGELRVSGWSSRNRLRAGSKHLCGQACLHKLADDFMARVIGEKNGAKPHPDLEEMAARIPQDTTLASPAAYAEPDSSVRQLTRPEPQRPRTSFRPELVMKADSDPASHSISLRDESPRFATPARRAEAWQRERERTERNPDRAPEIGIRRASQA